MLLSCLVEYLSGVPPIVTFYTNIINHTLHITNRCLLAPASSGCLSCTYTLSASQRK